MGSHEPFSLWHFASTQDGNADLVAGSGGTILGGALASRLVAQQPVQCRRPALAGAHLLLQPLRRPPCKDNLCLTKHPFCFPRCCYTPHFDSSRAFKRTAQVSGKAGDISTGQQDMVQGAARQGSAPVGAARRMSFRCCAHTCTMALVANVLPQPGPPVSTTRGAVLAFHTAAFCPSLRAAAFPVKQD